jgi:hypothetical protein
LAGDYLIQKDGLTTFAEAIKIMTWRPKALPSGVLPEQYSPHTG